MTFIEFFEKDAIENICSSLTKAPDRVILLGDKRKLMQKHADNYKSVLSARGLDVAFVCQTVNKNCMQEIIEALSALVETYDDCVFDLTGGEDLYLVAAGIVSERYKDRKIQMHRFNIRNNTIVDGDMDGETILTETGPMLSVEENIKIYGGGVVYDEQRADATPQWDMNDAFKSDINAMWDICRQDTRQWNAQIGVLETAEKVSESGGGLSVSVPVGDLQAAVERDGGKFAIRRNVMEGLLYAGLLKTFVCDDHTFSVTYKNEQVKRCLTLAGRVLEMKVYLSALDAQEKDGSKTYNDAMNGVVIDWDGEIGVEGHETKNEIDVMMMHGMVPVFVSCKNGYVDKDELYKLNAVASRFGGKYARKVLVATSLDESDTSNYLRQRAEDMGIRLVEGHSCNGVYKNFTDMNDEEINRVVHLLWTN